MRDPNRIPDILTLLQKGWSKVPDWRFGQLIENLKRYIGRSDLFFTEDDEMVDIITAYFDLNEEEKE